MDHNNTLKYRILDEMLFSKCKFCKSKKLYEEFLLSVINSSKYFLDKLNNEVDKEYKPPDSESKRECDCNSHDYNLDFKLLISESYMEAGSIAKCYPTYLSKGVRLIHSPLKKLRKKRAGLISYQLSPKCKFENKFDTKDSKGVRKCLDKNKNLLLFLPYEFFFENNGFMLDVNQINKVLTENFITSLLEFRKGHLDNYETYFAYIYKEHIIINEINRMGIEFVDKISLDKNEIYKMIRGK